MNPVSALGNAPQHDVDLNDTAPHPVESTATEKEINALIALAWPLERLAEGLATLAHLAGLTNAGVALDEVQPTSMPPISERIAFLRWLNTLSGQLGCELQPVEWQFRDIQRLVQQVAPALLRIPNQAEPRFFLMLQGGRQRVSLLAPNGRPVTVTVSKLTGLLQQQSSGNVGMAVERLLINTGVSSTRLTKAKVALVAEQMSGQRFADCWLLKMAAHRPLGQQLRRNHFVRYLLLLLVLTVLQQLATVVNWRFVGQGAFQNQFTAAGINAWALILLSTIPLSLLANWAQINLTLNFSRFTRMRLLRGILNLNPTSIRHLGAGQFLARVMQTESFQNLLLSGGFSIIQALVQIVTAALILRLGVGGILHSALLLAWLLLTLGLSLWYARLFIDWRQSYRNLTNDLVERMVAHRTRLAQENRATWHLEEDQRLERYDQQTRRLDRLQRLFSTLLNRGWFLVGLAGIALPFIHSTEDPVGFAVSIGGILLAGSAFASLRSSIISLADIYATWREIGPLFQSAAQTNATGKVINSLPAQSAHPLLVARNVQFRYRADAPITLSNINLTIQPGDRLLLEGPSGGGKSTLASLLIGLQQPERGLLLLHGLDQSTLGVTNWRRSVVSAPQFHENHILTETFGFNLLMGRRWPATTEDLQDAEQICHELGLGELLERMPGGMMQLIGESGWQLSHGERSRLFIARALLQQADLIVLDESFAALDPANLERAITCVLNRAPTLLVIAHP